MADEPTIRIDLASPVPVYRQIEDALRALMVEGRLRPGDPLPTVRRLAVDLGIHHNTVAEAYRQLAAEGWLDLRRHRGAVVCPREHPLPAAGALESFTQRLRELIAKAHAEGLAPAAIQAILEQFLKNPEDNQKTED